MSELSPLFDTIHLNKYNQVRVAAAPPIEVSREEAEALIQPCYDGSKPMVGTALFRPSRLSIKFVPVTEDQAHLVESVKAAEDEVLGLAEGSLVFDCTTGNEQTHQYCGHIALSILINRAANLIAARSRRGTGNVAFMHPNHIGILRDNATNAFTANEDDQGEKIGRWTIAGCINSTIVLYTSEEMPEDRIIVAYLGQSFDRPASLFKREDGIALYVLDDNKEVMGNVKDYLQKITVVRT